MMQFWNLSNDMSMWGDYVVRAKVPLAPFTTWKVGGYARWYAEPDPYRLRVFWQHLLKSIPVLLPWSRLKPTRR